MGSQSLGSRWPGSLAFIDCPISLALIAELQQAVLRVVPLATVGTLQVTAPCASLAIIVFRNGKSSATTAGDEINLQVVHIQCLH
jgi:hypothetical protein